jgi:hypothetical protein
MLACNTPPTAQLMWHSDDGVTLIAASNCCMTDQQAQMVQRQHNTRVLVTYVKLSSPHGKQQRCGCKHLWSMGCIQDGIGCVDDDGNAHVGVGLSNISHMLTAIKPSWYAASLSTDAKHNSESLCVVSDRCNQQTNTQTMRVRWQYSMFFLSIGAAL